MFAKKTYRNTRWIEPAIRASKEEEIPPGIVPAITRYYPLVALEVKLDKWYPVIYFIVYKTTVRFVYLSGSTLHSVGTCNIYHANPDKLDCVRVGASEQGVQWLDFDLVM